MSTTKFSPLKRWAIWLGHDKRCCYCVEPMELSNVQIDHVIPESYSERAELVNILSELGLPPDFNLNSPANLVPVHNRCNLQKADLIYHPNSIRHYHEIARSKISAINAILEKFKNAGLTDTKKAKILGSIEAGLVEPAEVWEVLKGMEFVPPDLAEVSDIIDDLAGMMDAHNYSGVIAALEQVKNKRWDNLSQQAKYKLTLNYGIAHFNLDQKDKGADYFIELEQYCTNDDASAYGCIAFGYAIKKDFSKATAAAEKSLSINPENHNAAVALVFVNEGKITPLTLDELIPSALQKIPGVAINIGIQLEKQGYVEQAFKIYSDLDDNTPKPDILKCEIWSQLAHNRMLTLSLNDGRHWLGQIKSGDKEILEYALEKLDAAFNIVKGTQFENSKWYLLTNRGIVRRALRDVPGAIADFNASLQLQKQFLTYRHLFGVCQDNAEKSSALISEMEALPLSVEERRQLLLAKAQFALNQHQIDDELLSALTVELDNIPDREEKLLWQSILIELLMKRKLFDNAHIFASQMISEPQSSGNGHFFTAKIFHQSNREKELIVEELELAISKINQPADMLLVIEIFELLMTYELYKKGIDLLVPYTDTTQYSALTKLLLKAYFAVGNHKKCVEIAEPLLLRNANNEFLVNQLLQIYDAAGLYDKAISLLEKHLSTTVNPEKQLYVNLALLYLKIDNYDKAYELVKDITDMTGVPLVFQFLIVKIFESSGRPEDAGRLAFKIRNANYATGEVHHYYNAFMMEREAKKSRSAPISGTKKYSQSDPEALQISLNCYFKLSIDENKIIERVVVETAINSNEITPSSSLYQKVAGKKVGDEVEFRGDTYRVSVVLPLEAYAWQDSIKQLEIIYGDKSPVRSFNVKGGTQRDFFYQVKEALSPFLEQAKKLEDIYKEGLTTIGSNANVLGLSPLQYWLKLTRTPEVGIFSLDDGPVLMSGLHKFANGVPIVMDLTALLTLLHIDGIEVLKLIANKVYISSFTLAHLHAELKALLELKQQPYVTHAEEVNGEIQYSIQYQTEVEAQSQKIATLIAFIEANMEIVKPDLSEDINERRKRDWVLETSFNATGALAKVKDAVLYSDDAKFKQVILFEQPLGCLSTIGLLEHLKNIGSLSSSDYSNYLFRLALLNYRNVPMSAESLYKITVHNKLKLNRQVMNALNMLSAPHCNDATAVGLTSLFLSKLYMNHRVIGPRGAIADYAVARVMSGRNGWIIKQGLLASLKKFLNFYPLEWRELKKIISLYY